MKIREAITENTVLSPRDVFVIAMHKLVERVGVENALAQIYGVAIEVAATCACYVDVEPNEDQNKEVIFFWSKELGDVKPNIFN